MSRKTHSELNFCPCMSPEEGESATRAIGQNNRHNTETVDGKIELWGKLNCALLVRARESFRRYISWENVVNIWWMCLMLRGITHTRTEEKMCCGRVVATRKKPLASIFFMWLSMSFMSHAPTASPLGDSAPLFLSAVGSRSDNSFIFKLNYFRLNFFSSLTTKSFLVLLLA